MIEIPPKLYFPIQEASSLTGVKPHVLRFWENEFPDLKPKKSKSGRRTYQRKDIERIIEIRDLLYERRFTIEGARQYLKERNEGRMRIQQQGDAIALLKDLRQKLVELKDEIVLEQQAL
ncbi:MAG: MerR family transcriptional regulator [Candidatus Auribacterota bacterium]|jgi:DNA-binding transcriptional MerR regulator|uniref:MerR family transcriptional regulator n=1 Tax=Candidatus Auribacter fodinae TaxID=2093366 RepID=A0A3A4RDT8_9BACT|nr:MAG: MerR family transcriptional regulator [Candidatus Auribacter fodinae]